LKDFEDYVRPEQCLLDLIFQLILNFVDTFKRKKKSRLINLVTSDRHLRFLVRLWFVWLER